MHMDIRMHSAKRFVDFFYCGNSALHSGNNCYNYGTQFFLGVFLLTIFHKIKKGLKKYYIF